jgi:hypothetical protein
MSFAPRCDNCCELLGRCHCEVNSLVRLGLANAEDRREREQRRRQAERLAA